MLEESKIRRIAEEPKIRFDHGYQSARAERKIGQLRTLVKTGHQGIRYVSEEHDFYFYHGYKAGIDSAEHATESTNAWLHLVVE